MVLNAGKNYWRESVLRQLTVLALWLRIYTPAYFSNVVNDVSVQQLALSVQCLWVDRLVSCPQKHIVGPLAS